MSWALVIFVALLGVGGTVTAAWLTSRSARASAKENLVISKEQGAATLLEALNNALGKEVERKEKVIDRLVRRTRQLERELAELRGEEYHRG